MITGNQRPREESEQVAQSHCNETVSEQSSEELSLISVHDSYKRMKVVENLQFQDEGENELQLEGEQDQDADVKPMAESSDGGSYKIVQMSSDGGKEAAEEDVEEVEEPLKKQLKMRFTERNDRRQYTRETKADRKGKKVGRWTRTEHLRFIQAIRQFGRTDYWKVCDYVGTRTAQQIRSHAQKYFSKVEDLLGAEPDADQLAEIEGLQEKDEIMEDEAYLSDTGAEVAKATKALDEFVRTKRGRHAKEDAIIIKELEQKVSDAVAMIDRDIEGDNDKEKQKKITAAQVERFKSHIPCEGPEGEPFKILSPSSLKRALGPGPSIHQPFIQEPVGNVAQFNVLDNLEDQFESSKAQLDKLAKLTSQNQNILISSAGESQTETSEIIGSNKETNTIRDKARRAIEKIVVARNQIMTSFIFQHKTAQQLHGQKTFDAVCKRDRQNILDLKKQVKELARFVATIHSCNVFSSTSSQTESKEMYSEIFEKLIMCQQELSFSLTTIKNAQQGSLRSRMSILFEESENESETVEEAVQDTQIQKPLSQLSQKPDQIIQPSPIAKTFMTSACSNQSSSKPFDPSRLTSYKSASALSPISQKPTATGIVYRTWRKSAGEPYKFIPALSSMIAAKQQAQAVHDMLELQNNNEDSKTSQSAKSYSSFNEVIVKAPTIIRPQFQRACNFSNTNTDENSGYQSHASGVTIVKPTKFQLAYQKSLNPIYSEADQQN